jgi:membrane fusion protein (multidrug efflux system)
MRKKEQLMADLNELDPDTHNADSEQSGSRAADDKIYRLTRRRQEARGFGTSELAEPESKVGPDDRKLEASPSGERRDSQVAASVRAPRKSMRRPLMFALLPVALGRLLLRDRRRRNVDG